ncbi:DUF2779 domain-containing protein [Methanobrevibacter sp.]|uniref:DUF2779 domain-containing protein n=1 Tax=Methanobrevibacter sp. TaxID=66852 RepID=UPI00386AD673
MNNINLSKSRYCECVQCVNILWLNKYKPEYSQTDSNDSVLENGRKVGELAKGLFGDYEDIPYDKDIDFRIQKTEELLQDKPNIITEASFNYENNFCSVDILKNDADGVEIYEVKSSTEIKDIYLDDVAYQYFVLTNAGLNVKKAAIVYINNEYVRSKELDMEQLFNIEDVTDIAREKQNQIKNNIDRINEFMRVHDGDNEPDKHIGVDCFDPYPCPYWEYCTRDLPKPNVFDISGMWKSKKFEKYYEGKISFEDLENEKINPKYLEQIDFELNDREPKIEKEPIESLLSSLNYPLYFIDYESCQYAIPELEGTKPYQQIPFQYSLHVIQEEGAPIEHYEFLAEADDDNLIRTFAESMIKDMSEDGSVIVYNKGFEATRNREIGEMYPDLLEEMERINSNIVDLMVPFRSRDYYTKEMKGSYSIKYVLPALYPDDPDLDYSNLPLIHNGGEASEAFLSLKDKTPEHQKEIRNGLLKYCKLDTLAMVKIWEKLKEVTD